MKKLGLFFVIFLIFSVVTEGQVQLLFNKSDNGGVYQVHWEFSMLKDTVDVLDSPQFSPPAGYVYEIVETANAGEASYRLTPVAGNARGWFYLLGTAGTGVATDTLQLRTFVDTTSASTLTNSTLRLLKPAMSMKIRFVPKTTPAVSLTRGITNGMINLVFTKRVEYVSPPNVANKNP